MAQRTVELKGLSFQTSNHDGSSLVNDPLAEFPETKCPDGCQGGTPPENCPITPQNLKDWGRMYIPVDQLPIIARQLRTATCIIREQLPNKTKPLAISGRTTA